MQSRHPPGSNQRHAALDDRLAGVAPTKGTRNSQINRHLNDISLDILTLWIKGSLSAAWRWLEPGGEGVCKCKIIHW